MKSLLLAATLLLSFPSFGAEMPAAPTADGGEVRVPLTAYTQMLKRLEAEPRPAPSAYAIGRSEVKVTVSEHNDRRSAEVQATLALRTFEDEWTTVPVLPTGTALTRATVDGKAVQLVQAADGLAWSTDKAGTASMILDYGIDARRSEHGFVLPVPVPRAAATRLNLLLPGAGLDVAVVPSADLRITREGDNTRVIASVPSTAAVLVSWRAPSERPFIMSRAHYAGRLQDDALLWTAVYDVQVFSSALITLPLMPADVTLSDLQADGKPAAVLEEEDRFATLLQGRGTHKVRVAFQTPVRKQAGPPQAQVRLPKVPVSHFEMTLPGRKELKVTPQANVIAKELDDRTHFSVYLPMAEQVVFSWVDAIPEDLRARVRANASLYHAIHAEEGVLHVHGIAAYEITHGETNTLRLSLPAGVQVNRITAASGGVSDWAAKAAETGVDQTIDVFLDRAVKGEYILDVFYEQLLGPETQSQQPIRVPLLRSENVHRQRGMAALLAGPELALEPVSEQRVTRVGENQLPAFVRNRIAMTVAHTYKYTDAAPDLAVRTVAPERKQGKFDAQVDTLISIAEVTLKGAATVEIDVKAGSLLALQLTLPGNLNVLGVTGPSLRSHQVRQDEGRQVIDLEFTQEMQGQFRIEVNYERILVDSESDVSVPTLSVAGAEVEHGRIAVEALTAVEVRAARVEQLFSLDLNELPRQLVLKTTNPILLAYKYAHAHPPFDLALRITRHREIDVQVAAIERAQHTSLYTPDGLTVTTARFTVRNSRRQFLRLELPAGSEVWSAFVDGKAEKPAQAGDGKDGKPSAVLLKMITSSSGFPVEIVYATRTEDMGFSGRLAGHLPRPDMVVTQTRWDLFLPTGFSYRSLDSNMNPVIEGAWANPRAQTEALAGRGDEARGRIGQPLRIQVPTQGVHYAFEKLYANQSDQEAAFSIRYMSAESGALGLWLSLIGVLLVWGGILALATRRHEIAKPLVAGGIVMGTILVTGAIAYLGASPAPASSLALSIALALGAALGVRRLQQWQRRRTEQPAR